MTTNKAKATETETNPMATETNPMAAMLAAKARQRRSAPGGAYNHPEALSFGGMRLDAEVNGEKVFDIRGVGTSLVVSIPIVTIMSDKGGLKLFIPDIVPVKSTTISLSNVSHWGRKSQCRQFQETYSEALESGEVLWMDFYAKPLTIREGGASREVFDLVPTFLEAWDGSQISEVVAMRDGGGSSPAGRSVTAAPPPVDRIRQLQGVALGFMRD